VGRYKEGLFLSGVLLKKVLPIAIRAGMLYYLNNTLHSGFVWPLCSFFFGSRCAGLVAQ
jgi:hypothetical protein